MATQTEWVGLAVLGGIAVLLLTKRPTSTSSSGSGITAQQYQALQAQNQALEQQLSQLQQQIASSTSSTQLQQLQQQYQALQQQYAQLQQQLGSASNTTSATSTASSTSSSTSSPSSSSTLSNVPVVNIPASSNPQGITVQAQCPTGYISTAGRCTPVTTYGINPSNQTSQTYPSAVSGAQPSVGDPGWIVNGQWYPTIYSVPSSLRSQASPAWMVSTAYEKYAV